MDIKRVKSLLVCSCAAPPVHSYAAEAHHMLVCTLESVGYAIWGIDSDSRWVSVDSISRRLNVPVYIYMPVVEETIVEPTQSAFRDSRQ